MKESPSLWRIEEVLTGLVGVLVLAAAGTGVFVPGFYQGIVDPQFLTGTVTADLVSLICLPVLVMCMIWTRRSSLAAQLGWMSLLVYFGYVYANNAFDRVYTVLFPLYMIIFGLSCFTMVAIISRLDILQLAESLKGMRLRRVTAVYLVFTGLVLYLIELPIILARIPAGALEGGTPFMVLDMSLLAPIAILTGVWLWQCRPWGAALAGIFLIKSITLVTSFLLADYIDWAAGRLADYVPTLVFTGVDLLACFFVWNYFSAFEKRKA